MTKIVLVAHGYPPESDGAIEGHVQRLARLLAARGHVVVVLAGTRARDGGDERSTDSDAASGARFDVVRLSRADARAEHWHKSASSTIPTRFRRLLAAEKPDVVHVHHWSRLSRDLVAHAAAERVPAVVSLHDAWSTCLIATRVRADTGADCDMELSASPCLACAARALGPTPWVPLDQEFMALATHKAELVRELQLARALIVPTRAQGERLAHVLGSDARALAFTTIAPSGFELGEFIALYERAIAGGAPAAPADVDAWFAPRMRAFFEENWDRGLSETARAGPQPNGT